MQSFNPDPWANNLGWDGLVADTNGTFSPSMRVVSSLATISEGAIACSFGNGVGAVLGEFGKDKAYHVRWTKDFIMARGTVLEPSVPMSFSMA